MDEPTAYCAPGRKTAAALSLTLRGEDCGEIIEHPWLDGDKVIVIYPEALSPGVDYAFPWPPSLSWYRTLGAHLHDFAITEQ
jgi:hypothetical protein